MAPPPTSLRAAALPLVESPQPPSRHEAVRVEERTLIVEQPIPSRRSEETRVQVQEPSASVKKEPPVVPNETPTVRTVISEHTAKAEPLTHEAERRPTDVIRAASVPRIEPAAAKPLPIAQPTAPTIRVTIGRVEVRAIVAAPPPARLPPAPRSPGALSLDEYFARRKGASR